MRKASLNTRDNILKIALQLFLNKGYKDVSYQDLIKETGLSKGAIYHHFKSKEDLLVSVFEFLMEGSQQPLIADIEEQVKGKDSFISVFLKVKSAQFKKFQKILGTKSMEFNKLLFFLEAINENEKLKKTIMEILKQETRFLEDCFLSLKKNKKLPEGKDPVLLAESLFWMLQGAEMLIFFVHDNNLERDFMKIYTKTINDFFKII